MGDHTYLTTKDYMVLQTMLDRNRDGAGPYRSLLERKVRTALISLREDVPDDVVTLNTRLSYRIDDRRVGPRLLVQSPVADLPSFALSIHGLHGLALLGLRLGATIAVSEGDGATRQVRVIEILSQPEAEARRREIGGLPPHGGIGRDAAVLPLRPRAARQFAIHPDEDDPGPAAA